MKARRAAGTPGIEGAFTLRGRRFVALAADAPFLQRAGESARDAPGPPAKESSGPVLSDAELAVARLAAAGTSNAGIAAARGVSARTIANQLASAFRKLGVGSRFELAAALEKVATHRIDH